MNAGIWPKFLDFPFGFLTRLVNTIVPYNRSYRRRRNNCQDDKNRCYGTSRQINVQGGHFFDSEEKGIQTLDGSVAYICTVFGPIVFM